MIRPANSRRPSAARSPNRRAMGRPSAVGHDYLPETGRTEFAWETTVGEQRQANIHVRAGVGEAAFIARRTARDAVLGAPRLILPSLQVNIRAGALPPAETSGKRFMKLPLNVL